MQKSPAAMAALISALVFLGACSGGSKNGGGSTDTTQTPGAEQPAQSQSDTNPDGTTAVVCTGTAANVPPGSATAPTSPPTADGTPSTTPDAGTTPTTT